MKKFLLPLLLSVSAIVGLSAQQSQTRFFFAYTHEDFTVSSSAVGFTASKVTSTSNPINSAELVTFTISCASGTSCPINILYDGTTPTSSVGQGLDNGPGGALFGHVNITSFKAIKTGATDAIIHAIYHR